MGKNTPKQTRAKTISIRLVDPVLTSIEHYSKIAGMDIDDYLVGCGIEYPQLIAELELIKQEKGKKNDDQPNEPVPTGTEEATGETQSGGC